jgi:hypothetical protein
MFFLGMLLSLVVAVVMGPLLIANWFGVALYKGSEVLLNLCADFVVWVEDRFCDRG